MHTIYMHIYSHVHALQTHTTHHTHTPMHHKHTHTHTHTYNPGRLLTCVHVLEHKVRAVSLSSCSNSHFHSALGRKGCSPALVSAFPLQEGMAVSVSMHAKRGSEYKGTLFHSIPITHPLWNHGDKANLDTQPALSELFPALDPNPPTLTPVHPRK